MTKPYEIRLYDGNMLIDTYYAKTRLSAQRTAFKVGYRQHSAAFTEIWHAPTQAQDTALISRERHGYDVSLAIRNIMQNCENIRPVLAGWEFEKGCFRLLVQRGYIVQAENHLAHEAGYWELTDKLRRTGRRMRIMRKQWYRREILDKRI